jgi:hypothetical protein
LKTEITQGPAAFITEDQIKAIQAREPYIKGSCISSKYFTAEFEEVDFKRTNEFH